MSHDITAGIHHYDPMSRYGDGISVGVCPDA